MRVVIDRVSKTYVDRRGQAVDALGEVSLAVESEEFVALLGPSGCGAVLYSHKFALDRARAVAFMKGYVKSTRHYFDAVLRKRSGPEFDEVVALTAKHTGARPDLIRRGFPSQDRDGRLMPGDIERQTASSTRASCARPSRGSSDPRRPGVAARAQGADPMNGSGIMEESRDGIEPLTGWRRRLQVERDEVMATGVSSRGS